MFHEYILRIGAPAILYDCDRGCGSEQDAASSSIVSKLETGFEKRKKKKASWRPIACPMFFFNRANPILITENGNTTASEVLQEAGKKGKASSNYAPCQVNVMLELLHVFNVCINRHIDVSGTSR